MHFGGLSCVFRLLEQMRIVVENKRMGAMAGGKKALRHYLSQQSRISRWVWFLNSMINDNNHQTHGGQNETVIDSHGMPGRGMSAC